jgi:hypothetical protein
MTRATTYEAQYSLRYLFCHRQLFGMQNSTGEGATSTRKVVFHRVAENLYRLENTGGYYALVKRGDKQFRRSLKTKDRKLAERRLDEYRAQVGNLTIGDDARLSFHEFAARWKATSQHGLKESTVTRRQTCINNLSPFFKGISIRNVQAVPLRALAGRAGQQSGTADPCA